MDTRATTRADVCNALRALAMDAVQRANSGHPGMPMGMAEIAEVVWRHHLRHNPANPLWADRDRFILSNGHGSMLIYSLLHLTGYDLPMEELKNFRQLHSKTPGHPEYGYTVGVETTTGPLGQGLSNAVGFALAERVLATHFNKPGHDIVDHYTYTFLGDGCLMEGVSHESCALAGTLGLGKLIALYDDNGISIDSEKSNIRGWFTDDVPGRFRAYGWNVIPGVDGHDVDAIEAAVSAAKKSDKPTIICCKTVIGKGAPKKAGTGHAHGAALGDEEIAATRKAIGWPYPPFEIPEGVYSAWSAKEKGHKLEADWNTRFAAYAKAHPELAAEFKRRMAGELPANFAAHAADFISKVNAKAETIATRKASQNAIEGLAPALPELLGGSADLTGSNLTWWSGSKALAKGDYSGNYVFYGVREFGMSAVMNGLTLHGGFIPYGATFLTFSDYARNALRMAALMKIRSLFVYTHDSIGLGEDGPTHQPIEHLASLRLIPGLDVWRPCDTVESAVAWEQSILRRNGPSVLVFSRQNLAFQARNAQQIEAIKRGGYVLVDEAKPKAVLIATGSELAIAVDAAKLLKAKGIAVRVVSMPATTVFDRQDAAYRDSVLPPGVVRIAVEAGVTDFWRKYVGLEGKVVGLDRFGESAPAPKLYEYFGITPDNVAKTVEQAV